MRQTRRKKNERINSFSITIHTTDADNEMCYLEHYTYIDDKSHTLDDNDVVLSRDMTKREALHYIREKFELVEYKAYDAESSFDAEANMITAFLRDCLELARTKYASLQYMHLACDASTDDILSDDDLASTCVVITKEKPNEPYASWGNARVF